MKVTEKDLERLFGTSDLETLARIARQVEAGKKNPRGAGRKRRFSLQDVVNMKALQKAGVTQAAIAKQYGTSRQTVSAGFRRLQDLCVSKLGLKIKYIGVLPWDSRVSLSVAQRVPLYRLNPSNPFSAAMEKTVTRILELEPFYTEQDSLDATDIELLQSEFENKK